MLTAVTNGGNARTIGATCSGVMKRGVFSTKMKPSASAPASTAVSASSRLVMPQILTRVVIVEWGGRDAPPISPPVRGAPDSCVLPAPRFFGGARCLRVLPAPGLRVLPALRCAGEPWPLSASCVRRSRVSQRQLADLGGDGGAAAEALAHEE